MSLSTRTPLRTRRQRRSARTAQFWQAKQAAASTPADRAALAWDRARSAVTSLPRMDQDAAWQQLAEQVDALRNDLGPRHTP